jgi:hypothetical protein
MAVKPSEYRKQLRKEVVLSSGYSFVIRKVRVRDVVKASYLPIGVFEDSNPETIVQNVGYDKIVDYMDEIIIQGVIEPKIVKKSPEECSDEELSIYELTEQDSTELFNEIMKFSGLPTTQEEKLEYAPFPEERNAASNRPDGEAIS